MNLQTLSLRLAEILKNRREQDRFLLRRRRRQVRRGRPDHGPLPERRAPRRSASCWRRSRRADAAIRWPFRPPRSRAARPVTARRALLRCPPPLIVFAGLGAAFRRAIRITKDRSRTNVTRPRPAPHPDLLDRLALRRRLPDLLGPEERHRDARDAGDLERDQGGRRGLPSPPEHDDRAARRSSWRP